MDIIKSLFDLYAYLDNMAQNPEQNTTGMTPQQLLVERSFVCSIIQYHLHSNGFFSEQADAMIAIGVRNAVNRLATEPIQLPESWVMFY
jgi:hypothetical protein